MSYTAKVFDLTDYATLNRDYATLDAMYETVTAAYNMELFNTTDKENMEIFERLREVQNAISQMRERMFDEMRQMEGSA